MRNVLKVTFLFGALTLAVTGCKKEEEAATTSPTTTPAPTKTELLTGKNWKVTAATSDPAIDWNGSGTMVTDVYSQIDPCVQDNLTKFNTNFTVTEDEGALKCDPADPQTTNTTTWAWNTNETILTIDDDGSGPGTAESYTLLDLNANTLRMKYILQDENLVNYSLTITWTKQ
jgi:hypothetical protein